MDFSPIALFAPLVDFIMHIDIHLLSLAADYGLWLYLILFLIVFAETGLVVTPFLPGDSLIFAAGSLASLAASALDPSHSLSGVFLCRRLGRHPQLRNWPQGRSAGV